MKYREDDSLCTLDLQQDPSSPPQNYSRLPKKHAVILFEERLSQQPEFFQGVLSLTSSRKK